VKFVFRQYRGRGGPPSLSGPPRSAADSVTAAAAALPRAVASTLASLRAGLVAGLVLRPLARLIAVLIAGLVPRLLARLIAGLGSTARAARFTSLRADQCAIGVRVSVPCGVRMPHFVLVPHDVLFALGRRRLPRS